MKLTRAATSLFIVAFASVQCSKKPVLRGSSSSNSQDSEFEQFSSDDNVHIRVSRVPSEFKTLSVDQQTDFLAKTLELIASLNPLNEDDIEKLESYRRNFKKAMLIRTFPSQRPSSGQSLRIPHKSRSEAENATSIGTALDSLLRCVKNVRVVHNCFEPFMNRRFVDALKLLPPLIVKKYRESVLAASTVDLESFRVVSKMLTRNQDDTKTLITWACSIGSKDVVEALLEQDEEFLARHTCREAAQSGRYDVIDLVCSKCGEPNDEALNNMVIQAAEGGRMEFIRRLWTNHSKRLMADIGNFFTEAVAKAGMSGNLKTIQLLFDQSGNNQEIQREAVREGLRAAAGIGKQSVVKYFFENPKYARHITVAVYDAVLEEACRGGHIPVFEYLLYDVDQLKTLRWSSADHKVSNNVLIAAAEGGNVEFLVYFSGIKDCNIPKLSLLNVNFDSDLVLRTAALHGKLNVVEYLLTEAQDGTFVHGVDPTANDNELIVMICKHGFVGLLNRLLQMDGASKFRIAGIDPAARNNQPLLEAASNGHERIVEILLSLNEEGQYLYAGVDAAARENQPLIEACKGGHVKVVDVLLMPGNNNGYQYPGIDVGAQQCQCLRQAILADRPKVIRKLLKKCGKAKAAQYCHNVHPEEIRDITPSFAHWETYQLVEPLLKGNTVKVPLSLDSDSETTLSDDWDDYYNKLNGDGQDSNRGRSEGRTHNSSRQTGSKTVANKGFPHQSNTNVPPNSKKRYLKVSKQPDSVDPKSKTGVLVPKTPRSSRGINKKALALAGLATAVGATYVASQTGLEMLLPDVSSLVTPCIEGLQAIGNGAHHALEYAGDYVPSAADITQAAGTAVDYAKDYTPSLDTVTNAADTVIQCAKDYTPSLDTVTNAAGTVIQCAKDYTPSLDTVTSAAGTVIQYAKDYAPSVQDITQYVGELTNTISNVVPY